MRLKCPRCGEGRLFVRWLRMAKTCPKCDLPFDLEQGYYIGAMYINYLATAGIGLIAGLMLVDRVGMTPLVVGLSIFGLLFPIAFFRHSRSLWRAVDFYITGGAR